MGLALTCIKTVRAAACAATLGLLSAAHAEPGDTELLAAKEAAQRGNVKALEALRAKLAGNLLEAYPA